MDTDFRKDVIAIAVGIFLGGWLAYSAGYSSLYILLGSLAGFMFGYLVRLIQEPAHVKRSLKTAWQRTVNWKPRPDWKEVIVVSAKLGVVLGSCIGTFIAVVIMPDLVEDDFSFNQAVLAYFGIIAGAMLFAVLTSFLNYFDSKPANQQHGDIDLNWWFRNLNAVALHYHAVRLLLVVLGKAVISLKYIPSIVKAVLRFTKVFAILVHQDKFTACGIWACIGVVIVSALFSPGPMLLAISAIIGGFIGAAMRRAVLYFLIPEPA